MTQPRILDGKWLSSVIQKEIRKRVAQESAGRGRAPGLGVILVGDNPASQSYVAGKEKTAAKCGFETFNFRLPASCSEDQLSSALLEMNRNERVDGILLQLPLPRHLDANKFIALIHPSKDADGLHPWSQGLLMTGQPGLRPCTPQGVLKLIDLAYSQVPVGSAEVALPAIEPCDLSGKTAIVIGRSILVGKPVALLLQERNATVVMAHSKTADLRALSAKCDIVVAAVGRPELVKADWVKEGAVVIDVGINRLESGKLVGDVDYKEVAPRSSAVTPVPGGVGPMTVAMLMLNTLQAFLGKS